MTTVIPAAWMPRVPMKRIHLHWTAGGHLANADDRQAYHLLVEQRSGTAALVRGLPSIAANSGTLKDGYAAHTLNANSNAIGISICGMMGAVESPFSAGKAPITQAQWDVAVAAIAELARAYAIPVTPKTILTHAEVQANLGIAQRAKWDIARLAFDPATVGAKAIGDKLRREVAVALAGAAPADAPEPIPAGGIAETIAHAASSSRKDGEVTGAIPVGTRLAVLEPGETRVQVRTPAGYVVWVDRTAIRMIDGPPAAAPTTPDPMREALATLRADMNAALDAFEAHL